MSSAESIITQAAAYADGLQGKAESFVANLTTIASDVPASVSGIAPGLASFAAYTEGLATVLNLLQSGTPTAPTLTPPDLNAPEAPTDSALGLDSLATTDVANIVIPDFNVAAPTLTIPNAPSLALPSAPGNAPTFTAPTTPDAPSYTLPTAPTFADIALPDIPAVSIPYFDGVAPDMDIDALVNRFSFNEADYESTLLDATKAKLLDDILNGGYGIDDDDEQRLWDRARDRETATAKATEEEARRQYAGRGFSLPPGALIKAMEAAAQNVQDASNTLSREIALKRGDLYVQNRQFAIQQSMAIENMLMSYHGTVMARALQAATALAETGVAHFNANVALFNAKWQAFQTESQSFEIQVRAAVERVNASRAQLEAARIKGDIDRNRVELYRAQLQGVESLIGIYRGTVEAARIKAEIERLKLEAFKENVSAYVATVQAKGVELNAYEAAIKGETAKQGLYESQVRGYTATVEASKVKVDTARAKLTAQIDAAGIKLKSFDAQVLGFKAALEGKVDVEKIKSLGFENEVKAFTAKAQAATEGGRLASATQKANYDEYIAALRYNLDAFRFYLERFKSLADLKLGAAQYGAQFYGQLVSGALSGINGVAAQIDTTSA